MLIGATGGSGTRVLARIVRKAGFFVGTNLNESADAMDFPEFGDRWINRYVLRDIAPLSGEEEALMLQDLSSSLEKHRSSAPEGTTRWGWKEPRSMYLLPFFNGLWPELKFIHLIRDGRDMAFSTNQNQYRKHSPAVLRGELLGAPQPVRSAALWARVNTEAACFGETRMGGRYLRLQYERLCRDPQSTISEILRFLEFECTEPDEQFLGEVVPSGSIGRWRQMGEPSIVEAIYWVAGEALHRLGYS